MYYLKMGLDGLKSVDLVAKSLTIETKMDGNASFPSPDPTLAAVTAKRQELETLMTKSSTGDREAIASRKVVFKELEAMLKKLAKYVSHLADGIENVILSSGFEVKKQRESMPPVSRPEALKVLRSEKQGEVILRWNTSRGALSYIVETTTTDPANPSTLWNRDATVTRITHTVENLTPGTHYWFRACAVGRNGISAYSNVELIMAS